MGEERVTRSTPLLRQCFLTASVAVNIVGHGCVIGYAAVLNPSLREPGSHIKATPSQESWIASIIGFALIVGNIVITPLMDTIGRKKSHLLTILPNMIGWMMLLLVNNVAGLIAARFLQGVAMGMLGPLGSIIIAEMTDPKNRGVLLSMVSLSLTTGVLTSHALGSFVSWQQTALICSFITFSSLILIIYNPESPAWLVSRRRFDDARKIFYYMRGETPEKEKEFDDMVQAKMRIAQSSMQLGTLSFKNRVKKFFRYLRTAFRKPVFYKPVIVMFVTYTMFQFAGINVISSYATDIIQDVVGPESNSKLLMIMLDVERLVCNILAVFLMRISKRRVLLFSNGALCIASYLGKALYVYLKEHDKLPFDHPAIPITLIAIYMFSITVGISSITFAISGEIFPSQYRGLGGGLSVLGLSLNFFLAVKCFPMLKHSIGLPMTYCMYAAIVFVTLSVIWFMLPETKDKTLQEIEDTFEGKKRDQSSAPLNGKPLGELRRHSSHILY